MPLPAALDPLLKPTDTEVPGNSGVRRRPVQRRGRATMESILDAAQELLAERGLECFTTNAIAGRAGINIATLYGYFSDKVAILHALSARFEQRRAEYLAELVPRYLETADWRELIDATIDQLVRMRRETPGAIELRWAIVAVPELRHLECEGDERVSSYLTEVLLLVRPDGDREELLGAARAIVVSGAHVLDVVSQAEEIDEQLLAGYRAMVLAHLERVLEPDHTD